MEPDPRNLFSASGHQLEDFWGRRINGPRFSKQIHLFGWPICISSNDKGVLTAVDHSLRLYSQAAPLAEEVLSVHLVVRDAPQELGRVPENLFDHIQYTGHEHWLAMHLGGWGLVYVDLDAGQAKVVLTPALAARPDLISRCVLNTIFNNFMEQRGFSMLHCTSLFHEQRLLLLLGAHNSGKSTMALRLALNGYPFVADSQIYVAPEEEGLRLFGFPIGWSKLRPDMLAHFPDLEPLLKREAGQNEVKFRVDLRQVEQVTVWEQAIANPAHIDLCLLERHGRAETTLTPATHSEVMEAVFHNSSYWHMPTFWEANLQHLQRLVRASHCHHLHLGTDAQQALATVERLMKT